jgi:Recombination endonuclease VII
MKRCPRCCTYRHFQDFPRNRSSRDGLGTYCKPCHREVVKKNVELRHGGSKNFLLKHRYGIDRSRLEALLVAQGGKCPICLTEPAEHLDHDHATGEVRGVLCFNCNGALGRFEDDVEVMGRAIEYLVAHGIER